MEDRCGARTAPACPFNSLDYARLLPHLGAGEPRAKSPAVLLGRDVPGTRYRDGLGPWPYLWLEDARDIEALRGAYSDFVTIVGVAQPGFAPPAFAGGDAVMLKDHFVYDPSLGFPQLNATTRWELRRAGRVWRFDIADDFDGRMEIVPLYDELKRRRGLEGGHFDFSREHFEGLARFPGATFFRVSDAEGTGGMVCAVIFRDWIQVLHITTAERGFRSSANYLMMHEILRRAEQEGRLVLTGGVPRGAGGGLERFKRGWSNRTIPVWLLRIVNDPRAYRDLAGGRDKDFFPAYRRFGG